MAINSPLLEVSINGAKGVLFSIAGGDDLTMFEIHDAAKFITESVDPNAKIIFGTVRDEKLKKGEVKITVIASGFPDSFMRKNLFGDKGVEDAESKGKIFNSVFRSDKKEEEDRSNSIFITPHASWSQLLLRKELIHSAFNTYASFRVLENPHEQLLHVSRQFLIQLASLQGVIFHNDPQSIPQSQKKLFLWVNAWPRPAGSRRPLLKLHHPDEGQTPKYAMLTNAAFSLATSSSSGATVFASNGGLWSS